MPSDKKDHFEMIKELRDERYDVDAVYIGDFKPEKDTIEEVIALEKDHYVPQRFRDEDKEIIAQEIFDIADGECLAHLMDTAENPGGIPVLSIVRDLTESQEIAMLIEVAEDQTADLVDHVDMGRLIGLMSRNWKELKKLTVAEIRNAMKNVYCEVDPVVMEAAIDTALYVVRAA